MHISQQVRPFIRDATSKNHVHYCRCIQMGRWALAGEQFQAQAKPTTTDK